MTLRRSLAFSFAEKYGAFAIGLIATAVLARLLTPADFGVFTVAASLMMLVDVLRDFGVGSYLVQERETTRDSVRTAFTVTLLLSLICAAGLLLATGPLVALYDEPGLGAVLPLFAANFLLLPLATPSLNLLRRDLAFGRLAVINLFAAAMHLVVVITLAAFGYGFMSLAWAALAHNTTRTLGAIIARPVFWAFRPSLGEWRKVVAFGGYSSAAAVINVFHETLPQLVIGRALGFAAVGLYSRAQLVCQLPDRLIVSALQPVLLPALAEQVRQGDDLKRHYLFALTCMSAVQWPAFLCLALLADPVVRLLLGPQWTDVPTLVRIMALGSLALFPAFMTYPVLVAVGRIRDTLTMSLISLPPSIAIVAAASFIGLEAVAAAQLVNAPLQVYVALWFVRRRLGLRWSEIAVAVRPSVAVAASAVAAPAFLVAISGFSFDVSVPDMIGAGVGAVAGWLVGAGWSGHPLFQQLRSAARALRNGSATGRERTL